MTLGHHQPLVSRCRVERGMYLLRYVEAGAHPHPRAEIGSEVGQLQIIDAPGRERAALSDPGQVLVIIAQEPCEFDIKVLAVDGGGTDAQFGLDLLDAGRPQQSLAFEHDERRLAEATPGNLMPQPGGRDDPDVSVLAHVSRRGDVRVGADAWVAGPNEVLQIEGLAIATGRQGLGARIRVQTLYGGQQWSRWHEPGEFAGSRQRADPLTGLGIALTGEDASLFEVSADVMALGSPSQTKDGLTVEFSGPDPIVGFRIRLKPVNPSVRFEGTRSPAPLRVFRAKR